GNQLNYITAAWTVGYVVGQIPSQMLLQKVRPSVWIPAMELTWSILTLTLTWCNGYSMLAAMRFFIGLAESTFYPAIQYVIGSWYKNEELAKRACIFHTASALGPIISGESSVGAYNGLNGVHGMSGWRWLFVCDSALSIPIALIGFLIMPDVPTRQRPSWLYSEHELMIAQKRMQEVGRRPPGKLTKAKVLGFFKTWHLYVLVMRESLSFNNSAGASNSMIFWLKSFNTRAGRTVYTVGQINVYPIPMYVVQMLTTYAWAWWSDAIGLRWPPIVFAGVWGIIVTSVLAATPVYTHIARRWAFYYMTIVQGGLSGIILAWANEITGFNNELRSFTVAACNTFTYAVQAWLPILIFPQVEQPTVYIGNVTSAVILAFMIFFAFLTLYLQRRDERNGVNVVGGSVEPFPDEEAAYEEEAGSDADSKKAVDSTVTSREPSAAHV
ncbi:MFS general substrate transporter, partial [Stereum hirsutum FP-91666 SS1]|uniref:MFS general substrate transporter n=1 Tax=Stereum hirsutum (strain FP-91666) TaxID=721885 RepID=UPI000444A7FC